MSISNLSGTSDLFKSLHLTSSHIDNDIADANAINVDSLPSQARGKIDEYKAQLASEKGAIESSVSQAQVLEDKINELIGWINQQDSIIAQHSIDIADLKSKLGGAIADAAKAQADATSAKAQAAQAQADADKAKADAAKAQAATPAKTTTTPTTPVAVNTKLTVGSTSVNATPVAKTTSTVSTTVNKTVASASVTSTTGTTTSTKTTAVTPISVVSIKPPTGTSVKSGG